MKIYLQRLLFIFTGFFIGAAVPAYAQEAPIHNQFFMNPFVYNPAYAGHDEHPVVYLSHRRQWMGIEGAPVSSNLSFHTELNESLAIGANIYTEKRGLLTTSSAELALGYKVNLGEAHYIQFGLAFGAGSNSIDLSEVSNVSAIPIEPSDNSMYLDGRFGIKYKIKRFNLGLALPSLFDRDYISDKGFGEMTISPMERYSIMASYEIIFSPDNFSFEPHVLYSTLGNDFNHIEGVGIFHIKNIVWLGASYRMDYGITGLGGVKIKDFLTLGYAYELSSDQVAGYTNGTHEIQLSIKLGEKKEKEKEEKISRPRFDDRRGSY